MSDTTTCRQCDTPMAAKGTNNMARLFCSSRCHGDYRRALNAKRRADREAKAEAALEHNTRVEARYQAERRERLARLERMTA